MSDSHEPSSHRIFLVRHGETDWNRTRRFQGRSNVPLNEEGKNQARALASALKDENFAAIYSSPLSRALETAGFIKEFHPSLAVTKEEGFIEMELGEFDGMDARLWAEQYPDFRKAWQEKPATMRMPGGENLEEVQDRALNTLNRILPQYPSGTALLICSHNFVLLTILCHALELSLDRFREIRKGTASFSIISRQADRFVVEVMNERSHLEKAGEKLG